MTKENPLSKPKPWDLVSKGYMTEVVPVFNRFAEDSFELLDIQKNHSVLDVACGPGTVACLLSPKVKQIVAADFSTQMLARLRYRMETEQLTNIQILHRDCQKLDLPENSFDLAFSQFGLMFFPDRPAGFSGIFHALKPGGQTAIYSWAPIENSAAMSTMMNALWAGFPETQPKKDADKGAIIKGLDDKDTFLTEMTQAGFENVSIQSVIHGFPVTGAKQYWQSMVAGSAPITAMKNATNDTQWKQGEQKAIAYLETALKDTTELTSEAYLAVGTKPAH